MTSAPEPLGLSGQPAQPDRVIADLRELAALTGGPEGARRVCWTPEWVAARDWLRGKLAQVYSSDGAPAQVEVDPAGNLWATLRGRSADAVVVGSHIDSVPNGGWLDGALGITGALEVLRQYSGVDLPVTLRLVDWADEEGARFGRSLFGSSAAAGTLDPDALRALRDRDGLLLPDVLAEHGVRIDRARDAGSQLARVAAYLELHIEQGPVLEEQGLAIGPVLGTFGVERHAIRFSGRTSHAGSTPMRLRHDAFLCAARLGLEVRESARRLGGVATMGSCTTEPGIVTAIAGACTVTLDQRCLDADALAAMLGEARQASERIAAEEGATVEWEHLWRIEPIPFHPQLIVFAEQACQEAAGAYLALPSGALHDAAEMARRLPTVMMFTSSTGGVSHNRIEDTPLEHLELGVRAYSRLAARTIGWVATGAR